MATISLDFSATLTWPSTRRWRAAKAETMWMAALAPFFWWDRREVLPSMAITPAGAPGQRGNPGNKAALELLGVERREDIAQVVVRGRAIAETAGTGAATSSFFSPKRAISTKVSAPASTASRAQQQHLVERIHHLAGLARIRQVFEMT